MTKEEAINVFKGFKFLPREQKAVDMAIEALKQKPCPDAVSRQEIMKAFAELPHEYENAEQRARTGGIAACQVIVEYAQPVVLTRSIDGNVSTEECLDAVKKIKTYLSRNEKSCSSTDWRDRNNKGFDTDMGYFYEGLGGLEKYLEDKKG